MLATRLRLVSLRDPIDRHRCRHNVDAFAGPHIHLKATNDLVLSDHTSQRTDAVIVANQFAVDYS